MYRSLVLESTVYWTLGFEQANEHKENKKEFERFLSNKLYDEEIKLWRSAICFAFIRPLKWLLNKENEAKKVEFDAFEQ